MLLWSASPEWRWLWEKSEKLHNPWELQQGPQHMSGPRVSKPEQKNTLTQAALLLHPVVSPLRQMECREWRSGWDTGPLCSFLYLLQRLQQKQFQWNWIVFRHLWPQRKGSLNSQTRDSGSHTDNGKSKEKQKQPQPPTFYPPSCQISIWSVSSGIGEAALYRKIRAWSAKISRIQWGIEESPVPSQG